MRNDQLERAFKQLKLDPVNTEYLEAYGRLLGDADRMHVYDLIGDINAGAGVTTSAEKVPGGMLIRYKVQYTQRNQSYVRDCVVYELYSFDLHISALQVPG